MEEKNNFTEQENQIPENEYFEPISKTEAMTGVITAPAETFEEISKAPKRNYWLIPVIVYIIIGVIVTFFIFRDEQIMSNTMDKQRAAMEKKMDEQVKEGKMSKEDANIALEKAGQFMNPKSPLFQAFGYGGAILTPFFILFILSVIYLLILKFLKADTDFTLILNVVGLSFTISIIGSIITLILSILTGEINTASLGLILNESTVGIKGKELLSKIDIINIWSYIVTAIGLSKVARISSAKAYGIVFGVWIFWILISTGFSILFN